jgi:hypothetical protein
MCDEVGMDNKVLTLNAEINRLSSGLLSTADDTWSEIQRQTVKIIQEATERMVVMSGTTPNSDYDHWLHDLRSPGASMLSAVVLLLDEVEYSPSTLNTAVVATMREKIVQMRAAVDEMAGEHAEW